jgi:hypothetical protein
VAAGDPTPAPGVEPTLVAAPADPAALAREPGVPVIGPVPPAGDATVAGPVAGPTPASTEALAAALTVLSQQPSVAGQLAVALSGLPPVEHEAFKSRAAVSELGSSTQSNSPGGQRTPAPMSPGGSGPIAGIDAGGSSSGGAGSSGSSGGGGMPPAVLADPAAAPAAFALSVLTAPERRITWWYPEVVVGPG